MSPWLFILCYCIVAYGACNVIVFGSGPFRIFEHIRNIANYISPHFGMLFSCMMCLPTNFGLLCSLFDWFLVPGIAFTPFNILLSGTELWWLAMLCDAAFTSGIVWITHHVELFFENYAENAAPQISSQIIEEDENNIVAEDITLKKK